MASVTRPSNGQCLSKGKKASMMQTENLVYVAVERTNCKHPQPTTILFLTRNDQPDTLSNAINNCVQLISVVLCPLDALLHLLFTQSMLMVAVFLLPVELMIFLEHNNQLTTLPFF